MRRFRTGELLAGRFKVVRFIAAGGMGEVYEAEDLELREHVALKTILPDLLRKSNAASRFKREIHLARKVTHPNVCRIFDLFRHAPSQGGEETLFVSMELLHGTTLAEKLEVTGRIPMQEALPLVTQMASALSAAHDVGIVHLDFKPSNVVLVSPTRERDNVRVVVTDFGLASRSLSAAADPSATTLTMARDLAGTPAYMAPEQIEGHPATAASDIYALGLVIYEVVTGQRPFRGDSPMSTALMRLSQAPTPPRKLVPELSPVWEAVILRCLEREPAKRFAGAQDVAAALIADAPREHTATLSGGGAIPNNALGIEEQTRVLESAAPPSATPSHWSRRKNSIPAACLLILSVIVILASAKYQRFHIRPADRAPSVVEKESSQIGNVAEDVKKSNQETSSDPRKNRVAQDVRESTEAVKEAKKEVSADPRKELANMGIQWNLDSFKSSTRSGDIRALELFLKGGFSANQLDEDGTMFVLTQAVYGNVPNFAQVLDLFQKNGLDFHAVETGNENQLFQFRHPNHTLEFEAYDAAAFKRNVSIVQILHQAGANSDSIIADYKSHLQADTNAIKAAMNHPESNDVGALRMNLMGYAAKLDVILTALGIPVDTVIPANPAPMP